MRRATEELTPGLECVLFNAHHNFTLQCRFSLIPFTVTIPPEERDPDLGEKLKAEWPAILQWMINGCLDWQREGLNPPKAVTAATDYMEAQDAIGAWIEEALDRGVRDFLIDLLQSKRGRPSFALSDSQLLAVMVAARDLPAAKRCALIETVAAELRDRPKFSDAALAVAVRAALAAIRAPA